MPRMRADAGNDPAVAKILSMGREMAFRPGWQKAVAAKAGIHPVHLSRILGGTNKAGRLTLRKLEDAELDPLAALAIEMIRRADYKSALSIISELERRA